MKDFEKMFEICSEGNFKKTMEALDAELARGDADAQYLMGFVYQCGLGVEKDSLKAADWFEKSASQENALGKWGLGYLYWSGDGISQDKEKAFVLVKDSLKNNSMVSGAWLLGMMYKCGDGTDVDINKAVYWLGKGVEEDHPIAQYHLGELYEKGQGVQMNESKAKALYVLSANQGFEPAIKKMEELV